MRYRHRLGYSMRIRYKPKHDLVKEYVRQVNLGLFIPGSLDQVWTVRHLLEELELHPAERRWLNEHRRRLEDPRPRHDGPGRPTKEAADELAVRVALYEMEKIVDEAESTPLTGGQDDE